MPADTRIFPILDYDMGYVLYSVQLVGALTEWQQRDELLQCQLVGRSQQQQREQLEWRCAGIVVDGQVTRLRPDESRNYYKESMTFVVETRHKLTDDVIGRTLLAWPGMCVTRFHCQYHEQHKPHPTILLYGRIFW